GHRCSAHMLRKSSTRDPGFASHRNATHALQQYATQVCHQGSHLQLFESHGVSAALDGYLVSKDTSGHIKLETVFLFDLLARVIFTHDSNLSQRFRVQKTAFAQESNNARS